MAIQEYTPISTLQRDYLATIRKTERGPVILSQHSKPIAILLSTADYEKLVADAQDAQRLRRWQRAGDIAKRMDTGDYTELSPDEILALGE